VEGMASHNRRAEAWKRERERESRASENRPEISPQRLSRL
jgi:hypothetical protein